MLAALVAAPGAAIAAAAVAPVRAAVAAQAGAAGEHDQVAGEQHHGSVVAAERRAVAEVPPESVAEVRQILVAERLKGEVRGPLQHLIVPLHSVSHALVAASLEWATSQVLGEAAQVLAAAGQTSVVAQVSAADPQLEASQTLAVAGQAWVAVDRESVVNPISAAVDPISAFGRESAVSQILAVLGPMLVVDLQSETSQILVAIDLAWAGRYVRRKSIRTCVLQAFNQVVEVPDFGRAIRNLATVVLRVPDPTLDVMVMVANLGEMIVSSEEMVANSGRQDGETSIAILAMSLEGAASFPVPDAGITRGSSGAATRLSSTIKL